jgi:2-polyprenyl-3-methyl-5-hydroxy-6-metoxy-1,4-benzoquinol methylase
MHKILSDKLHLLEYQGYKHGKQNNNGKNEKYIVEEKGNRLGSIRWEEVVDVGCGWEEEQVGKVCMGG